MIHYVVKTHLELSGGFWGSVADGAKFPGMQIVSGRQRPKADERSASVLKTNAKRLSEAEAIVGAFQTVLHDNVKNPLMQLDALLQAGGVRLDSPAVQRTWRALVSFRDQWQSLADGATIELDWPRSRSRQRRTRK